VLDVPAEAMRHLAVMQTGRQALTGDDFMRVLVETLLLAKMQQQPPQLQLRQEEECVVCMDADCSVTLLPCGHRVLCATCCATCAGPKTFEA
jgi:hypothetical protein